MSIGKLQASLLLNVCVVCVCVCVCVRERERVRECMWGVGCGAGAEKCFNNSSGVSTDNVSRFGLAVRR